MYREAVSAGNTSQATDWLIILYILGFTVIAIVAILIVLGVYRCILKKAIHRNRAHQLSKVVSNLHHIPLRKRQVAWWVARAA